MAAPFGSGYWSSPSPDTSPIVGGGSSGKFDRLIDPVTYNYVRTANGEWTEVSDSRSTMLLMLLLELGASAFDPGDGTNIAELRRTGDPVTPEDVLAETIRAGGILQAAGTIADLSATVRDSSGALLRDQNGALLVRAAWRDLASGTPIDEIFSPG